MILPDIFTNEKKNINVIIETPRGSHIKYKYEEAKDYFALDKFLPVGITFPLDFGFIPHTRGGDGDPLDVLVLSDFPLATGTVAECRLIGVITAQQKEKGTVFYRNDRFVAVAIKSHTYADIQTMSDLGKSYTDKLINFFVLYNAMQGREFKTMGIKNNSVARKLIEKNKIEHLY